ncbi:MAG: hypothetical protein ACOC1K_04490 [Nanoarchaeota archaeon]
MFGNKLGEIEKKLDGVIMQLNSLERIAKEEGYIDKGIKAPQVKSVMNVINMQVKTLSEIKESSKKIRELIDKEL